MKKLDANMLSGPLFSNIIIYTIPIILTSLLQLFFNAADLIIVGRFCGSISVAAVGATNSITNLLINFFIGLSIGAGVIVAHGLGAKEDTVVHNTIHTALPVALLSGVIVSIIGVCYSGTFLRLMGTPENVLPLSTIYMKIYFAGITFTMIYNYCAAILRAAGDTKSPLIFLTIAGIVNVLLNVLFVTVFHLNVAGVALATTISQGISAVLVVLTLMKRNDACKLELKKLRFHGQQLCKMLLIGLPAGIQTSLFSISNVLIQSSINSFGDTFVAGNAAASNIEGFAFVSINSFHQTAVNFIGQNVGAKQHKRVANIFKICLGCVALIGISLGILLYLSGPSLLSIYITDSKEAISYGMLRLTYVGLFFFLAGLMDVSTGALRGMGKSFVPMLISILCVCGFRIVWIYTIFQMPQFHTPQWLYISYPISWAITFLCQLVSFIIVYIKSLQTSASVV